MDEIKSYHDNVLPVCTLSPFCRSDIVTLLPFSSLTLAVKGKQPLSPPEFEGGGAAVVVVVVVVVIGEPTQQWKVLPHLAKQRLVHCKTA